MSSKRLHFPALMTRASIATLVLLATASLAAIAGDGFSPEQWRRDVEALADPRLEGRALGSKGAAAAASLIEERFRALGLETVPGIGMRQDFPVGLDLELEDSPRKNSFSIAGPASFAPLVLRKDYQPLPFSADGSIASQPVAFAGYAISAPELRYDDFEGVDVRGKVVVAFRREPQERSAESRFRGLDFTRHASFVAKAGEVAKRGGLALIVVTNRLPEEENDELPAFSPSMGPSRLPIPVVMVRAQAIAPFFVEQGYDLGSIVRAIDRDGTPQSFLFRESYRASLHVTVKGLRTQGSNVLGWKPGQTAEYVVVGAHYDHVGTGKRFSMDPSDKGKIHPGADDNASGVAAMLELARVVARGPALRRGILFVAFGGEEHGLFGSSAFLDTLPKGLGRLAGMINFDMVGRLREDELYVAGVESVPALDAPLTAAAQRTGLTLQRLSEYPYNMSDHGNFLEAGVPSVLFFTGLHLEYHTARDTADRVSPEGAVRVLQVAMEAVRTLADQAQAVEYVPGKDPGFQRNLRELASPSNPFQQE